MAEDNQGKSILEDGVAKPLVAFNCLLGFVIVGIFVMAQKAPEKSGEVLTWNQAFQSFVLPIMLRSGCLTIGVFFTLGWHFCNLAGVWATGCSWLVEDSANNKTSDGQTNLKRCRLVPPTVWRWTTDENGKTWHQTKHKTWRIIGMNIIILHVYFGEYFEGRFLWWPFSKITLTLLLVFIDTVVLWSIPWAVSTFGEWYNGTTKTAEGYSSMVNGAIGSPDDDQTIYLSPKSKLAGSIFAMQLMLIAFFIHDAVGQSAKSDAGDHGRALCYVNTTVAVAARQAAGNQTGRMSPQDCAQDLLGNVDVLFWVCGSMIQILVAATEDNMSAPFSYNAWAKGEKNKDLLKSNDTWTLWDARCRMLMDYIINSLGWSMIFYLMPILASMSDDTDSFIQNILVFTFIVKVDNFMDSDKKDPQEERIKKLEERINDSLSFA